MTSETHSWLGSLATPNVSAAEVSNIADTLSRSTQSSALDAPTSAKSAASAFETGLALRRQNAVRRPKAHRILPSIDEVIATTRETDDVEAFAETFGHSSARYTVGSRFYEHVANYPESVRTASVIEARSFRASLKACAKKALCIFKRQEKTPVHATTNQTTTTNSTTNKALSTMAHSITLQSAKLRVSVGPAFDGEELTSRLHDIHDCNNATTGAPLKRHNALRWPGDDVVEVPKKEDVKGLRRTKAVRHRRTNTQESQDFANVRVAWKSDVDAGAKAKGTSSTYGSEKALPLRRKSRFVEHMAETDTKGPLTEDEAWETAATIRKKSRFIERVEQTDPQNFLRGVRIGHAMGSAAMKVVAGAKSALRRGVVCPRSGMGMYEGT